MSLVRIKGIVGTHVFGRPAYCFKIISEDKKLLSEIKDIVEYEMEKHHHNVDRHDNGYYDQRKER